MWLERERKYSQRTGESSTPKIGKYESAFEGVTTPGVQVNLRRGQTADAAGSQADTVEHQNVVRQC